MSEQAPTATPVQLHGPRLVGVLYGLFRNLEIHEESNQLFDRLTTESLEALRSFKAEVGEDFTLQMFGQEVVVCGRLLRLDDVAFERATRLGELFVRAGIGGILLGASTAAEDLTELCKDMRAALKDRETTLTRRLYGSIIVASLEEDPSSSLETQPEQLAIWLLATLLDLSRELERAAEQGKRPSLLPLKRVLQRTVEAAQRHGAVFQVLPLIRSYERRLTKTHGAVCECLMALAFGVRLGLTRPEVLATALTALLTRISAGSQSAVRRLLSYRGLGDLAPMVLLAAHDLASPSESAGLPGQILTLVRAYESATTPGGPGLAPAEALTGLLERPPPGVESELLGMFAAWQGRDPLGSPVELSDGQIALVFGPSALSPGRSRLAPLSEGGKLGPDLDLGSSGAPAVVGHPSPAALELDLTRLRDAEREPQSQL